MDIEKLIQVIQDEGFEYFGRYYSSYIGSVADNEDPEFRGRLKLKVPQIFGDDVHEYWAPSKGMFTGIEQGLFAIPEVGSLVWVSFQQGDPRYPIWEYGLCGADGVPEAANNNNGLPTNAVYQFGGHRIEMDKENERIVITDVHGNIFTMNATGVSMDTDKLSLGTTDGSAEPALLGDKTEEVLSEIRDLLQKINTILLQIGAADTPVLASLSLPLTYAATMTANSTQIIADLASITSKIALIKSSKVTLD